MKETSKLLYNCIILVLLFFPAYGKENVLSIGNTNAKITVKVFSSLTCPHCANFHETVYENLKKEYIDPGVVKFEHHAFPLDLAALNAEIVVRCHKNNEQNFELLGEIYEKQSQWAVGSDINPINESLKKIGLNYGLNKDSIDSCLNDEEVQDQILDERIQAQKKYKIQSTPTIYINEKKYEGDHKYEEFRKKIEKLL
jgi:protein-disulfide isomerase